MQELEFDEEAEGEECESAKYLDLTNGRQEAIIEISSAGENRGRRNF